MYPRTHAQYLYANASTAQMINHEHALHHTGFMVGPDSEVTATVRKFSHMLGAGASVSVPHFNVVVRKAYGLGAMAMAGGALMADEGFSVSWPTGEFGPMVRPGHRGRTSPSVRCDEQ